MTNTEILNIVNEPSKHIHIVKIDGKDTIVYSSKFVELLELIPTMLTKADILDKIKSEIIDTGAYEQEVNGKTEFLKGINYSLDVIDKCEAESKDNNVIPNPKIGYCKDCKYFEYDSVAKIDGMSLIVAHEICKKWSDGCKTSENGYCFMFEPKMPETKRN